MAKFSAVYEHDVVVYTLNFAGENYKNRWEPLEDMGGRQCGDKNFDEQTEAQGLPLSEEVLEALSELSNPGWQDDIEENLAVLDAWEAQHQKRRNP